MQQQQQQQQQREREVVEWSEVEWKEGFYCILIERVGKWVYRMKWGVSGVQEATSASVVGGDEASSKQQHLWGANPTPGSASFQRMPPGQWQRW